MFSQILVPLDGSVMSEESLPVAQALAKLADTTVHLIRVVHSIPDLPAGGSPLTDYWPQHVDHQTSHSNEYLGQVESKVQGEGISVVTETLEGTPESVIIDYARSHNIDVIIMAAHGHGGYHELWLGSITDRVLRSSPVQVIVLRSSQR